MPFKRKPMGQVEEADIRKRRAMLTPLGKFTLPGGPTPNGDTPINDVDQNSLDDVEDFEPSPADDFGFDFPTINDIPQLTPPPGGWPFPRLPTPSDIEFPDIGTEPDADVDDELPPLDEEPMEEAPPLDEAVAVVEEAKPFPWKYVALGVGALVLFTLMKK